MKLLKRLLTSLRERPEWHSIYIKSLLPYLQDKIVFPEKLNLINSLSLFWGIYTKLTSLYKQAGIKRGNSILHRLVTSYLVCKEFLDHVRGAS